MFLLSCKVDRDWLCPGSERESSTLKWHLHLGCIYFRNLASIKYILTNIGVELSFTVFLRKMVDNYGLNLFNRILIIENINTCYEIIYYTNSE